MIESTELLDYDESDEIPEEDYESESDYGKSYKGKGKRIHGRPKTKPTEEARIVAALEVRRKRMRLNHGTPNSNEENPKRHLFGPLAESRDLSETASPTPSKPARRNTDMKRVDAATSSHSLVPGRVTRRQLAMQTESTPSKHLIYTPPSLHGSVSPAAQPSLIVKLKTRRPSVPTPAPKRRPGGPLKKDKGGHKSAVLVESDEETTEKVSTETLEVDMRGKRKAKGKQTIIKDEDAGEERATGTFKTRRHATTRQWRRAVPALEAHLDAPAPKTLSQRLPSSPNINTPISKPSAPLQPSPTSTFAPYPLMSPRSVSPFTRGARIALENILADHQSDPLVSLIDLVEELDDTRPIVNDWEHVTVMKGGSWIYQVMRDVWEEAAEETDEEDDEIRDEDLDIEDIVEKVGGWVDREMGRLGSGQE